MTGIWRRSSTPRPGSRCATAPRARDAGGYDPLSALRAARVPAYRSLLRARALALSRLGRRAEAAGPLGELIQRSPRDEEVLAELLRCEAAVVGPAAALGRYAEYQQRLRDELGSDPGPALQRVQAELLQADAPVIRRGVRHEPNPLLGRDDDIAAVAGLLRTSRVTSIVGPGGLGKTRLAHAVSSQAEQRVVHVVELAGVAAAAGDVAAEVASALGVGEDGGSSGRPLAARLDGLDGRDRDRPGSGPCAAGAGQLRARRAQRGQASCKARSCHSPGNYGCSRPAAPRSASRRNRCTCCPELDLATTAELFRQRAMAVRPDADLPADAVREVCGRLDGLPLAAELAAARVRVMSVAEIARSLDDRFAVLRSSARDAPQRHCARLHAVIGLEPEPARPGLSFSAAMRGEVSVFPAGSRADAATAPARAPSIPAGPRASSPSRSVAAQGPSRNTRVRRTTVPDSLETVREFAAAHRDDMRETET